MNETRTQSTVRTSLFVMAALAITATMILAQGRGQREQGFPGGGPPGQPFGQGRGFGGPGGGMPFATGTITGGDLNAGVIQIQSQFGGGAQNIRVTGTTKVVSQQNVTVADLKVGDQVQVQGVPTAITASSLTAGMMPDFFGGVRGGPGGGGPGFGGPGQGRQGFGGQGGQNQAFASATGKITSTSPLTIALSGDVSVALKLGSNARVTKFVAGSLNSLKKGDRIMASGQSADDGSFSATMIGVNIEMGGGFGGPGGVGRGGGFGPGGPGGFGPGGPGGPPGGPGGPPPPPGGQEPPG